MKILMTGGTGMIGQELGLELVRQGHSLMIVTRDEEKAYQILPFPFVPLRWDGTPRAFSPEQLAKKLDGIDAIVHLAGEPIADRAWSPAQKQRILDSRAGTTRMLVDALLNRKRRGQSIPSVMISASAIGFYEKAGFLKEVCDAWEKALGPLHDLDMRLVVVRIGIVLGKKGGMLARLLPIFKKGLGGPLSAGQSWMSWVHQTDLTRIFLFALGEPSVRGIVEGVAPHPVQNSEFTRVLSQVLGRPAFFRVPQAALKLVLKERAEMVLSSLKVLPKQLIEKGFQYQYPELRAALDDLLVNSQRTQDQLEEKMWLPYPLQEIFDFFSDARNLERITPPWLNFHVEKLSTPEIQNGTLIDYRLKIRGIPVKWQSKIEEWSPPVKFVDRQLKGPYAVWHHTHEFEELAGGTLIQDRVSFKVPAGWLGDLLAGNLVRKDVGIIFKYRKNILRNLFPNRAHEEGLKRSGAEARE